MAEGTKAFLVGASFAEKLKQTVAVVEGRPYGSGGYRLETDLSGDSPTLRDFRIATFTGAWSISGDKEVTLYGVTSTPNTVSVTNVLFEMPDQGNLPCAIARYGTAWHLVDVRHTTTEVITNVTLGTAGLVFTKIRIQVASTATASSVTIGTTACA
jgi:hypothetical protein